MSALQQLKEDPRRRQAFDSWYGETYPKLFVSAFRMTHGDRLLAEDLCHDAILAFFERGGIHKVEDQAQALAYLRRSVANAHISRLRRSAREVVVDTLPEVAADGGELDGLLAQNEYASVVQQLDPNEQELLGMLLAGTPLSEIAETLGISYSNAGVRVHRLRRFINNLRSGS